MVWSAVAVQPNSDVRRQMYCEELCRHTTDWSTTTHNNNNNNNNNFSRNVEVQVLH